MFHTNALVSSACCLCVGMNTCRVAVLVSSANMDFHVKRECVERALVLDNRVCRFSVPVGENPGEMVKLLEILAREDVK